MDAVIEAVQQFKLDILHLTDLRTTQDKMGKNRRRLELLLPSWTLFTDISKPPGGLATGTRRQHPVGVTVGTLVHASLATHMQRVPLAPPSDANNRLWHAAVDGRLLVLRCQRMGLPLWYHVVVYQHVAADHTAAQRSVLLGAIAQVLQRQRKNKL